MRRAKDAWDRFYRFQPKPWRGERDLAPLFPWLASPVLELGCGNGKTLRPLQSAGHDVVAIDRSWNALATVTGPRVLADVATLPLADAAFATVLDLYCTQHLAEDARSRAMQEARRVLADGGHLIVERLGAEDLRAGNGEPAGPGLRRIDDGRVTFFGTLADLAAEGTRAGFAVAHETEEHRPMRLRGEPAVRHTVRVVFAAR